jgi:hypothetical protein
MQCVDGFLELGGVHHTVDAARVPDANLSQHVPSPKIVEGEGSPQLLERENKTRL